MNRVQNFLGDESGVTAIEYALIASLIAVFIVARARQPANSCQGECRRLIGGRAGDEALSGRLAGETRSHSRLRRC